MKSSTMKHGGGGRKHTRHNHVKTDKSTSGSDAETNEKHSCDRILRRSLRLSSSSGGSKQLVDCAYDADAESATSMSSPEKVPCPDPYEMDMVDDLPALARKPKCTQKGSKMKRKKSSKVTKKSTQQARIPSSTPVLTSSVSGRGRKRKLVCPKTPEVTPILPVADSQDMPSLSEGLSEHKPRLRMSTDTPSLPSPVLDQSQGDSGIVLSPTPKRSVNAAIKSSVQLVSKMKKRGPAMHLKRKRNENSGMLTSQSPKSSKQKRPLAGHTSTNIDPDSTLSSPANKPTDDSCFGFSSISSPFCSASKHPSQLSGQFSTGPRAPPQAYRSHTDLPSDSSPGGDLEEASPESQPRAPSPLLFSFSTDADSMELNRSSSQNYKLSRPKKTKQSQPKKQVSKLDGWVSKFNMEIEDIEKFDLIIE